MKELLKAIEKDSLVEIKRLLKEKEYDLNSDVVVGLEYDLEEHDEIPLLFYMVQNGASLEAIELLLENGMDLETTSREGVSVVDYAIKYKRPDIVRLCQSKGFDLTKTKRKSGLTPLMLATSFNDIEMMQFLIDLGANPNEKDRFGMSAIDYAYKMGQKKAAKFLENLQNQ